MLNVEARQYRASSPNDRCSRGEYEGHSAWLNGSTVPQTAAGDAKVFV